MLASIRVSISNPNLIFGAKTSSRKTAIIYGVVIICLTPFLPLIIGLQLQILYLKERLIKGRDVLGQMVAKIDSVQEKLLQAGLGPPTNSLGWVRIT